MAFQPDNLRKLLAEGKPAFGLFLTIGNPEVAEIVSLLGFDWVVIDMEHAPLTPPIVEAMLIGVRPPTTPIVRVPALREEYFKAALDAGAAGVMVPHVDTGEEAKLAAKLARYPPRGLRGVGPRRSALYGLAREEYRRRADEVIVVVQVETREAVENVEDIVSAEGVDAYFIGPSDLSASLGCSASFEDPVFMKAVETVVEAGKRHGVPGGIYCGDAAAVRTALELGLQLLALGSDYRMMMAAASKRLEEARRLAGTHSKLRR